MKTIDLGKCFPDPQDQLIPRGPLPKQAQFMRLAMRPDTPKFVRYVGGVGAGKSLVGCVTVLSWAVQYPGDYLICRQFMPELRDTTYKTFLEICPKELIKEHRVADGIVRIKCADGSVSNIMFRGLEEWDKHRSLNLNAFYIDEANQVAEGAFMLLQGRLRGRFVRKGIITQNSGGRDWSWRWFVQQDHIKADSAKLEFANIKAPSTENVHLPKGYVKSMLDTWSEARILREIYADEDSFEGQIYTEFKPSLHVIRPFRIPAHWTRIVGADHGFRNPAAFLWGAIDEDENIYIYREFYEREWIVDEICRGNKKLNKPGIIDLQKGEKIEAVYIDPSVKAKRSSKNGVPYSNWDEYMDSLPEAFPLLIASNDVQSGIDRVKRYMKLDAVTGRPKIQIFSDCTNLIEEIVNYRYQELRTTQSGKRNEKEDPVKINDHACDALRYLIMSRPIPQTEHEEIWKKVEYNSLAGRLIRDLQIAKEPTSNSKDPFEM